VSWPISEPVTFRVWKRIARYSFVFNMIYYLVATVIAIIMTICICANNLHVKTLKYLIHKNSGFLILLALNIELLSLDAG